MTIATFGSTTAWVGALDEVDDHLGLWRGKYSMMVSEDAFPRL